MLSLMGVVFGYFLKVSCSVLPNYTSCLRTWRSWCSAWRDLISSRRPRSAAA